MDIERSLYYPWYTDEALIAAHTYFKKSILLLFQNVQGGNRVKGFLTDLPAG